MSQPKVSEELNRLFEAAFKKKAQIFPLKGGGSTRKYFRLKCDDISAVGVFSENTLENKAFIRLAECFRQYDIKVPYIIKVSEDKKFYLIEDLGDHLLLEYLVGDQRIQLARRALEDLITIQIIPEEKWEKLVIHNPFSYRLVSWDLNYFKYCFLKIIGLNFNEETLQNDFDKITTEITKCGNLTGFMYRDFQSRNIMMKDGDLWFIDFQGGRKGPVIYDMVSFLWQAKAPFTSEERMNLAQYYMEKISAKTGYPLNQLQKELNSMVIFRTLQVLGAYGLRGLIEKKPHFIESIPLAIKNLWDLRQNGILRNFPEIETIADKLQESDLTKCSKALYYSNKENEGLTVSVYSFSYKKGYPQDPSGNGGGFIFDCRGIHNPGRYEQFKSLTGLDKPVCDFLIQDKEAPRFIEGALNLVRGAVQTYLRRGFTSLQVGFGCTGGQHRSVFCAEEFAKILKKQFPEINLVINHRERGIIKEMK